MHKMKEMKNIIYELSISEIQVTI